MTPEHLTHRRPTQLLVAAAMTIAVSGAWVVPATTAPMPTRAKAPGGKAAGLINGR